MEGDAGVGEGMAAAGPLLSDFGVRAHPSRTIRAARDTMPSIRGTPARCGPLTKFPLPPQIPQEHGVAASDIKLLEAGIHVEILAYASKKRLKDIKGLSEMKVEKLKMAGESQTWHPFQNFFCRIRANNPLRLLAATRWFPWASPQHRWFRLSGGIIMVTTGASKLDELLGGVSSLDLFKLRRVQDGQDAAVPSLAVTCQLPLDQGGAEGKPCTSTRRARSGRRAHRHRRALRDGPTRCWTTWRRQGSQHTSPSSSSPRG